MVIHNLHILRALGRPAEAKAKLTVDPDAVLSLATASQRFQAIARRGSQEPDRFRRVELRKLPSGNLRDGGEPFTTSGLKQLSRIIARKAPDHTDSL